MEHLLNKELDSLRQELHQRRKQTKSPRKEREQQKQTSARTVNKVLIQSELSSPPFEPQGHHTKAKSSDTLNSLEVICYECLNLGHHAKECPSKRVTNNISLELKKNNVSKSNGFVSSDLSSSIMHLFPSKCTDTGSFAGEEHLDKNLDIQKKLTEQGDDVYVQLRPEPCAPPPVLVSERTNATAAKSVQHTATVQDQEHLSSKEEQTKIVKHLYSLRKSFEAKCDLPIIYSDFVPEKLTYLEPVQPSSIVSVSQLLEEESQGETQRSLSLVSDLEQPTQLVLEPVLMPFPFDYPRKHCKEIDLVRTEPNLFILISSQDEKRFGFENVKEVHVSNPVFDKMIPSFETFTPEKFFKPKDFMFDEFHEFNSSLRVSLFSNAFELFRTKKEYALVKAFPELNHLLKNLLSESNLFNDFCKSTMKYHVFEFSTSSIMHLFCPMRIQKGTGTMEKHKYLGELTIKEKPPDLHQPQSIYKELKRGTMSGAGEFNRSKSILTHGDLVFLQFRSTNQEQGNSQASSVFKDKPPDALHMLIPNYNSQQGKKIIVADTIIPRYASLLIPNDELLELEHIKMLYNSNDNLKNVFPFCEKFEHKKFFRHGGFIFDRNKLCKPSCSLLNSVLKSIDKLTSASHFAELFFGEVVYYDSILSFNLDDPAKHVNFVLDDLCRKLLTSRHDYFFCTHDLLPRDFAVSIQDVELNFHDTKTWLYHVWLKKMVVRVFLEPMEHENVKDSSMIQEKPPDPTPIALMRTSDKHIQSLIQISTSLTLFVSHAIGTMIMILLHPGNIEKNLSLFKEYLGSNSCLRKEEHEKDYVIIQAETCSYVYYSMTVIMHFLFAKGVDQIAGMKKESPELEDPSKIVFVRTGIGVILMQDKKTIAYFRMIFEVGEKVLIQLRKKRFPAERESKLMPKIDGPFNITRRINNKAYELELQGKYNVSSIFKVSNLVHFIADELDLRSNPFQEGGDDVILPSTKNMDLEPELEPDGAKDMEHEPDGNKLEEEDQLGVEEQLEPEDAFRAEKEYTNDVILTSLVLIYDHQMGMCLICTLFPLSSFVPLGFLDKVFNEANDSHSNHPFVDPDHGIASGIRPNGGDIKSSLFYAHYKSKKSPKQADNFQPKKSYENGV